MPAFSNADMLMHAAVAATDAARQRPPVGSELPWHLFFYAAWRTHSGR
jgi:hypothetical protein